MRPDRLVAPALGALWTQRARLGFAWDVLRHAVCSDCSLGSSGMRDSMGRSHLCGRRLGHLTRETAVAFAPGLLAHTADLHGISNRGLRGLGRIPRPMLRRAGQPGFSPLSWEDATNLAAARLRDARGDAKWSLLVDPRGLDLESLFQLGRFAVSMERRHREGEVKDAPPLVALSVPASERRLRARARDTLGHASSSASSIDLKPGDSVLLVTDGDQPLLDEFLEPLRRRGVLTQVRTADEPWPDDARHTLVFGRAGTIGALAAGLPLHKTELEGVANLGAAYLVGEKAGAGVPGLEHVPVRVHQASVLDASMLIPAPEAVLLLPASSSAATEDGGTYLSDDLVVRFSPSVLGAPRADSKPHWEIPVLVAAMADPDLGHTLAEHDSGTLRAALAASRPGLGGVLGLSATGDSFLLPSPVA